METLLLLKYAQFVEIQIALLVKQHLKHVTRLDANQAMVE
jgi:hypothetical protein